LFEERFKQYIIKYEKKNYKNSKAETNNIFENLILDIESKLNLKEPTNRKKSKSSIIYLMVFGKLIPNKTISISILLANKIFSYLLILEDMTKPTQLLTPLYIY
jgi:hypothetical protein